MLDHLEPKEDSTSNTKVIKDFKETIASQIVQRFELHSFHLAHPLLIGSLLDPRFKCITLSDEGEIKKLKQALIELMETEQEQAESCTTLTDSASPATPKKQKLTALDKLLGLEQLSQESRTLENKLEKYLAEAPISRKENPLSLWKANATHYNTL